LAIGGVLLLLWGVSARTGNVGGFNGAVGGSKAA